jgi:hypothetical protein
MSNKMIESLNVNPQQVTWAQALRELDAEIAASPNLTEEEKRFLLEEMDQLSDEEWEPITCAGEPISETIIRDRGERYGAGLITSNPSICAIAHRSLSALTK